jgi:hypothetical protein
LYEEVGRIGPKAIGLALELQTMIAKSCLETAAMILNCDRSLRWLRAKV